MNLNGEFSDSKLCIKIAPLSMLNAFNGYSPRVGIEYRIKDYWSIYNEAGFFLYRGGVLTKFEIKNYLEDYKNVGNYVSAELFYKYQSWGDWDSVHVDGKTYRKDFTISKHVECLTIKYGNMKVYAFGIVVDVFAGLGIRFKQAKNTLTYEENMNIQHSSDYGPNVFVNEGRNRIYPNFDFGIKIGYRIK